MNQCLRRRHTTIDSSIAGRALASVAAISLLAWRRRAPVGLEIPKRSLRQRQTSSRRLWVEAKEFLKSVDRILTKRVFAGDFRWPLGLH